MKSKARQTKEAKRNLSSAQEVLYQHEFKLADRAYHRSKNKD